MKSRSIKRLETNDSAHALISLLLEHVQAHRRFIEDPARYPPPAIYVTAEGCDDIAKQLEPLGDETGLSGHIRMLAGVIRLRDLALLISKLGDSPVQLTVEERGKLLARSNLMGKFLGGEIDFLAYQAGSEECDLDHVCPDPV